MQLIWFLNRNVGTRSLPINLQMKVNGILTPKQPIIIGNREKEETKQNNGHLGKAASWRR